MWLTPHTGSNIYFFYAQDEYLILLTQRKNKREEMKMKRIIVLLTVIAFGLFLIGKIPSFAVENGNQEINLSENQAVANPNAVVASVTTVPAEPQVIGGGKGNTTIINITAEEGNIQIADTIYNGKSKKSLFDVLLTSVVALILSLQKFVGVGIVILVFIFGWIAVSMFRSYNTSVE